MALPSPASAAPGSWRGAGGHTELPGHARFTAGVEIKDVLSRGAITSCGLPHVVCVSLSYIIQRRWLTIYFAHSFTRYTRCPPAIWLGLTQALPGVTQLVAFPFWAARGSIIVPATASANLSQSVLPPLPAPRARARSGAPKSASAHL
jgi:hypothetical protein